MILLVVERRRFLFVRLLIAEAEKGKKVLELAATRNPLAQASLLESRKSLSRGTKKMFTFIVGLRL